VFCAAAKVIASTPIWTTMTIKLEGWQSVGILLSAIWFVAFATYFTFGSRANYEAIRNLRNACDIELQSRNNVAMLVEPKDDRVAQINKNRDEWRKCLQDARSLRRELSGYSTFGKLLFLYAADLGTIVFGWLLWWLGAEIWSLIKRMSA
jgi:hypothetical protein